MSDKIKQAIEQLAEKVKDADAQAALELSHAALYLAQTLVTLDNVKE